MKTKYTITLTVIIFSLIQSMAFGHTNTVLSNTDLLSTVVQYMPVAKPIARNDSAAICENSGVTTIPVQANDSSPDGDTLTTSIVTGPKHGTASVNGTAINYTPNTGFSGRDTLTYMVCDKNVAGNCDTAMVFITVKPSPTAVTGPTRTMCYGDTIQIGGPPAAGDTYLWTPNRGLSSYTVSNPMASPADTTTYTLTVTDTVTGCKSTDSVLIIVKPVPTADVLPSDTVHFCKGDSIILTSTNGARFLWSNGDTTKSIEVSAPGKYSVAVTYPNGCTDYSDPTTVFIDSLPAVNAGSNKSICEGDSTTIGSASVPGVSYMWSPSGGLSSDTVSDPTASPTVTTTYTLTVTDTNSGCKNTDKVTVTVSPQPIANAGSDTTICDGGSVTIGSPDVAGVSYSWSPSTGLSSATSAQPNASPTVTTTYTLTASNGTCSSKDSVTITVDPSPVANAGPNKIICTGDSTTIGTPGISGVSYSWSPSTGLSSDTVAQPNASPSATTTYTLTASNGVCSNKDSVTVTVKPQPVANAGRDTTICQGNSVTIGTPGVAGISYSWSPASGLSSATSAQPNASPTVTTIYTLTASNGTCSSKDSVTITINPSPVANAGSATTTICKGDSITIGAPPVVGVSYSWSPLTGLSSATSSQTTASPAVTTTYTLTASNGKCSSKDSVTVTVNPSPVANAGSDTSICKGNNVIIGSPGVAGITYSWSPSNGLSSTTAAEPNASPTVTTIYTLTASNGMCSSKDSVTVTVNPMPVANAGPDKSICNGDSTTIGSAPVSGMSYKWSPSSGLSSDTLSNPKASPATTTTYILSVSNGTCTNTDTEKVTVLPQPVANAGTNKTICTGDSTTIGTPAVGGVSYSWSPTTGLSSGMVAQPNASPSVTTTYTLTASNGSCSNKDSVTITVNPKPAANAGRDTSICKGSSVTIGSPAFAGETYSWSPTTGLSSATSSQPIASPTVTTTYTLSVANGTCSNTDTVTVTVLPQPVANAGEDRGVCLGDSVMIGTAYVAGVSYTWSPASGLSSSAVAQPMASPAVTTRYICTASNGVCSNTDTVVVTVSPTPVANAGTYKQICAGDSASIGSGATSGLTYQWSPASGLSSATSSNPKASPAVTTLYTLTVSNGSCSSTDTVSVTVNPLPEANVGTSQYACGGTVMLGAPAVSGNTYLWTPATGLNSNTISQPTATINETATYTLVETDTATGCSRSNTVEVTFAGGDEVFTGISPNGDGINDWWYIPMLDCFPTNSVVIVNRWGSEVWSATDYNNTTVRWDGKNMNGTELPDGTYYYTITYDNNNSQKRGWVFLKR